MKKLCLLTVLIIFGSLTSQAQKNETVVKETVTEKVTVKDNESVKTLVKSDVKEVVSELELEGTNQREQSSSEVVIDDRSAVKTALKVTENEENKAALSELQNQEAVEKTKAANEEQLQNEPDTDRKKAAASSASKME
jgi:hypothetical protein